MMLASARSSGRLSHATVTSWSPAVELYVGSGGAGAWTNQGTCVSLPSRPVQASQSKSDQMQPPPWRYTTSVATLGGSTGGGGKYAGSSTSFCGQCGSYSNSTPSGGS